MNIIHNDYKNLICVENIFTAWQKFRVGKNKKIDVMEFERHLEDNLFSLYHDLQRNSYSHSGYEYFRITDPKKRDIHKAKVKDRIIHQVFYDYLCRIYEPFFIYDSYSSRLNKGTHRAVKKLGDFTEQVAKDNFGRCYALKCDIKKFFENIDHKILLELLADKVKDKNIMIILRIIIKSFNNSAGKGIPLGNITSQIFANIYLHQLDIFVKNKLKLKYYLRYNDDFVFLDGNQRTLFKNLVRIQEFVRYRLLLEAPDDKIVFRKLNWGIDFCGYVILPGAILLRQNTKRRMMKNIVTAARKYKEKELPFAKFSEIINSYFGLLKHCHSHNLKEKIRNKYIYGQIIRTI